MMLRVSTNDGVPIYLQIVSQVKYMIASGRLQVGDRLPPVRKLAEQLVINPNTVARAYRELESSGVISSRRGSGAFVTGNGSPLAKRQQNKILNERIDMLLTEAKQMNVDVKTLMKLIKNRDRVISKPESGEGFHER